MEKPPHPDIDSRRAWLVAFAATICHAVTIGLLRSFGIIYAVLLQEFKAGRGTTSMVPAINLAFLNVVGPLAGIVISNRGCRVTLFIGAIIYASGLVASAFAHNIWVLFATYGVIAGLGVGMTFSCSIAVVSEYFEKYRALAMGVTLAGGGLGSMVYPWMITALIDHYSWRGSFAIIGAISLHMCAAALVMRPISLGTPGRKGPEDEQPDTKVDSSMGGSCMAASGLGLFVRWPFMLLCINTLLFCFAQNALYVHVPSFAAELGFGKSASNTILSTLGFGGIVGRMVLGVMTLSPKVNRALLFCACYFLSGVAIVVLGAQSSLVGLVVCTAAYSLSAGAFGPLLSEMAYITCGKALFVIGYGWMMIFMGTGHMTGAPAAGLMRDLTLSYPYSFYMAGICGMLSGLVFLPAAIKFRMK